MHWMFPDKSFVPNHYHITEVGKFQKDFIDCGGTVRSVSSALVQIWVANDLDHRLKSDKLDKIMQIAESNFAIDDLPIEVEYEQETISQYPIAGYEITPAGILFYLGSKQTACLAPEKCGLGSGCCK